MCEPVGLPPESLVGRMHVDRLPDAGGKRRDVDQRCGAPCALVDSAVALGIAARSDIERSGRITHRRVVVDRLCLRADKRETVAAIGAAVDALGSAGCPHDLRAAVHRSPVRVECRVDKPAGIGLLIDRHPGMNTLGQLRPVLAAVGRAVQTVKGRAVIGDVFVVRIDDKTLKSSQAVATSLRLRVVDFVHEGERRGNRSLLPRIALVVGREQVFVVRHVGPVRVVCRTSDVGAVGPLNRIPSRQASPSVELFPEGCALVETVDRGAVVLEIDHPRSRGAFKHQRTPSAAADHDVVPRIVARQVRRRQHCCAHAENPCGCEDRKAELATRGEALGLHCGDSLFLGTMRLCIGLGERRGQVHVFGHAAIVMTTSSGRKMDQSPVGL